MELYEHCPILNSNLQDIKANIKQKNWDWLDVDTGMEGAGKSSVGLYKCNVVDEHFQSSRQTVYSQKQFSEIIDTLDKGQAIYVDEGVEWLFNRNWNTPESRATVADLMVMREMNLFVCVNITNIRYLDVYIREDRLRSMFNVITYPVIHAGEGEFEGQEIATRERGIFEGYSRASVLDHFDPKRDIPLIPDWIEPFPRIQDLDGGQKIWDEYHNNKRKFLSERKKIRAEANKWKFTGEGQKEAKMDYGRAKRSENRAIEATTIQIPT